MQQNLGIPSSKLRYPLLTLKVHILPDILPPPNPQGHPQQRITTQKHRGKSSYTVNIMSV